MIHVFWGTDAKHGGVIWQPHTTGEGFDRMSARMGAILTEQLTANPQAAMPDRLLFVEVDRRLPRAREYKVEKIGVRLKVVE